MSRQPLNVMILWHMHQPYYKDIQRDEYMMPWVRLHATKDYLDMALLASRHEGLRLTFNMVPSLLEQIEEYAAGSARDAYLRLAEKPADQLSLDERVELLHTFFNAQEERMIRVSRRYGELLNRRGAGREPEELRRMARLFSVAELRDLQTWFFLAWIDPLLRDEDPFLAALVAKDRGFSEEDKLAVLEAGRKLTARIIPTLADLWGKGKIELATTPYYHPILPLLIDTNIARRARPEVILPSRRFVAPEDARLQIELGLDYCEQKFGRRPRGMWPSEGSVCPELVPMMAGAGVNWIATDEDVLASSLGIERFARDRDGKIFDPDALYRPYVVEQDGGQAAIFFRDHQISDLIGFRYANVPSETAASDLLRRLERIHESLGDSSEPHVVSIILDGENCWEHFERDGLPFLNSFYEGLVTRPTLRTVTPSQYLEEFPAQRRLDRLHSGSWINRDFHVWIGHPEDNAAWDLLAQARADLEPAILAARQDPAASEAAERAHKSLLIAEGSDWNWWYGDDHSSAFDAQFDALYRQHLINAYTALGQHPPGRLHIPISRGGDTGLQTRPRGYIEPRLDGRISDYFEWYAAGRYSPAGDSMHQVAYEIEALHFGFSREACYLRVDLGEPTRRTLAVHLVHLVFYLFSGHNYRIVCPLNGSDDRPSARVFKEVEQEGWVQDGSLSELGVGRIIEGRFPFSRFGIEPNQMLRIQVALEQEGLERERCPSRSPLSIAVPGEDFEEMMWTV